MMKIIERYSYRIPKSILLLFEVIGYWRRLRKYNAYFKTDDDMQKMQYTLLRENHVIEKGMSMKNTRKGFGQEKIKCLIDRLKLYNEKYGKENPDFLIYPLSTIQTYIKYQKDDGIEIHDIESSFSELCSQAGIDRAKLNVPAGINLYKDSDIIESAKGDFSSLLYSRHSIRYFKDELPSREILERALTLAARTPSACNRQAWHTHIYFGDKAHDILDMQGGCNGFSHDIHCCVVVTADMKGFLDYEPFQCYIDGGLYAQNLINALHYEGLGTIPLSCGFYNDKLSKIQSKYDIPKNEVMIVIIGCGVLAEEMKIATSTRRDISTTNTYH